MNLLLKCLRYFHALLQRTPVTLGDRGFLAIILHASYVSYTCLARRASGQERNSFDSAEPVTIPLIRKHPESGCFTDWLSNDLPGDVECIKRCDWTTITIGA